MGTVEFTTLKGDSWLRDRAITIGLAYIDVDLNLTPYFPQTVWTLDILWLDWIITS